MFFDSLASKRPGGDTAFGRRNLQRVFDKKFQLLRERNAVRGECVEIGPGHGMFARQCRDAGMRYRAIERNPTFQRALAADGFDVVLGTAPPLPYEDDQADLVSLMTVLEHMPTFEQGLDLLQECNRVLRPGGFLALEVPDYLRCGIDFHQWDYTHSFILTPLRLQQVLQDSGFQVVDLVLFAGSIDSPVIRWPLDLLGFVIHSRPFYWLCYSLGLEGLLEKYHKTFEPNIFVIAVNKNGPEHS